MSVIENFLSFFEYKMKSLALFLTQDKSIRIYDSSTFEKTLEFGCTTALEME